MPYYDKSEDWLKQSALLIEARPNTTRITTTYSAKPSRNRSGPTPAAPSKSHGHLVLKTYDPLSGSCLKYKTVKAAEVSRLIQMLGTLAKKMAGLPDVEDSGTKDEVMADAPPAAEAAVEGSGTGASTPAPPVAAPTPAGGGGKGRKKKGKR